MKLPKFSGAKIAASFKTRSFRVGGYSVMATAIVIAIAIVVNMLVGALPSSVTQFDTTANQLFTISEQTEKLVAGLQEDVTIYWVVRSGYEDTGVETLLERYESLGDRLKVVKKDPDVNPTFVEQYASSVTDNSLIVECGDRYRYIDYYEIYVYDYYSYYYYGSEDVEFAGETELTSAIDYCISEDLPKVYVLTGHGEGEIADTFTSAVEDENIELEELSLLTQEYVPDDADCVLIYAPQRDISGEEQTKLQEYLGNGGNLMLISDPPQDGALTNLDSLMADYGVTAAEGIVVEGDQNYYVWGMPYYLLPEIETHTITSPLVEGGYYVLLPVAQGLEVSLDLPENVTVSELLTTSDSAFSKIAGYDLTTYDREEGDLSGPYALAVAITETLDDGLESNIVWVSSAALLDEQTNTQVSGGNQDFFLNALSYLCDSEESGISIHAKTITTEYLTLDSGVASTLTALVVGVIPVAYLAIGILIWVRRKHR